MKIDFGCRNMNITLSMHNHIMHRLHKAVGEHQTCVKKAVVRLFRFEDHTHDKDLFLRVLIYSKGHEPVMIESRSNGFFELVDQLSKKIERQDNLCQHAGLSNGSCGQLQSVA